jgi:uncharacterized membrane protein
MAGASADTAAVAAPGWFDSALHSISLGFEAAGVAVIALGLVFASVQAVRLTAQGGARDEVYHLFRTSLARGILLGLEFLVAADIIGTVAVEPTLENLSVLGLIVLIRTFLSFSLQLEITGRWPWQTGASGEDARGGSSD